MNLRLIHIATAGLALCALAIAARAQSDPPGSRELDEARRLYPPEVTRAVLTGTFPSPAGVDDALRDAIGRDRLTELRTGSSEVSGRENDVAALCLARLKVPRQSLRPPPGAGGGRAPAEAVTVARISSQYPPAPGKTGGTFRTGQDADLVLSAIDFDQTGGPLLFNHPMGIATDGSRLFLADTYNNRVLIWNSLPDGNTPPDLVLGQPDFDANATGSGLGQMNFPVNVACGGGRLVVADTQNHRLLIWSRMPEKSGAPADYEIRGGGDRGGLQAGKSSFIWPWGVWTDGRRLVLSSTMGGWVLIWNEFPKSGDVPADLLLRAGGMFGTPRTITSDGTCLIVGDHNSRVGVEPGARPSAGGSGTYFWRRFPTRDDQPCDYFRRDPSGEGPWLRGTFLSDGRLCLLGRTLYLWNSFPQEAGTAPDLAIRGYDFRPGDHVGAAAAGERLYIVCGNGNRVVAYRKTPTGADQPPDFAIGAPDIHTDTLQTNFIMSNPAPTSDGKSLFVASDFDCKMYVWRQRPDRSGAPPDFVYSLPGGVHQVAVHNDRMVAAGNQGVFIWDKVPRDGERPSRSFRSHFGGVPLQAVRGVALDDRHLYLSDLEAGRVYVWKGIPSGDENPVTTLEVKQPSRISSDGEFLVVASPESHGVFIFRVGEVEQGVEPQFVGERHHRPGADEGPERYGGVHFNLALAGLACKGRLFVADAPFGRVLVWDHIEDALAARAPDAILGASGAADVQPEIGRNRLFSPASLSFDGCYLWVGETKFSERLLRFSPKE